MDQAAEVLQPIIRSGFTSYTELFEMAVFIISDGMTKCEMEAAAKGETLADTCIPKTAVEELIEKEWKRRLEIEASWGLAEGERTSGEKLDAAFVAMKKRGVIGRMKFLCCSNCGHKNIEEGLSKKEYKSMMGYVFFHEQDVGRLLPAREAGESLENWEKRNGEQLFLGFGHFCHPDHKYNEYCVAKVIVDCLSAEGLPVEWDGNIDNRIKVDVQPWRKKLNPRLGPPKDRKWVV